MAQEAKIGFSFYIDIYEHFYFSFRQWYCNVVGQNWQVEPVPRFRMVWKILYCIRGGGREETPQERQAQATLIFILWRFLRLSCGVFPA